MNIRYIDSPSKNFEDTILNPEWIVIHCIGYSEQKALRILMGDETNLKVSVHYFVPQLSETINYPIYRLVPDNKCAYHAGASRWQGLASFNSCSIGIEFHCPNYAYALERDDEHLNWYHFEKFYPDQITAGIALIKSLAERYAIASNRILLHSDIAPWRLQNGVPTLAKTDPGAYFPAEVLASAGLGVWPKFERTRNTALDTNVLNAQKLLKTVGYHVELTNALDFQTICTIKAFKLHFMPECYKNDDISADISEKMIIGLENLIDKQYRYETLMNQQSLVTG